MAVKMVVFWCSLVLFIVGSNAAGEFDVIHSPRSLSFIGSSKIPETLLKEVFSAALGLSVSEDADWDGMGVLDPFSPPEAVVELYVDGVSSLSGTAGLRKSHYFPLIVDEYEPDTFEAVEHRIKQRFGNVGNSKLLKIKLANVEDIETGVFAGTKVPKVTKMSLSHLKFSFEEDNAFLHELAALNAITEKVRLGAVVADNVVDFYNFRFQSLHALSDFHGPNSLQVKEAKKLLGEAISELSAAFEKAYDGSVLVTVVCTDVAHTRRTARAAPSPPQQRAETLDDNYGEDYSAIFNIILWFNLVFAFAIVAIVYAIMDMDPGRDSIIYRMTSTRMKKDN